MRSPYDPVDVLHRWIACLLPGLLALCGLSAPAALAACDTPQRFGSLLGSNFSYVLTPGVGGDGEPTTTPDLAGAFWILGNGDPAVGVGVDNGGFPASSWLGQYVTPGYTLPTYIGPPGADSWDSDPRIDGCPDTTPAPRCMAVVLADVTPAGRTFQAIVTARETVAGFALVRGGNAPIVLARIPAPQLTSTLHADPGTFTLQAVRPNLNSARYAVAPCNDFQTGYRIYRQDVVPGGPAPTDFAVSAGWMPASPVLLGDAEVAVACSGDADIYFALTVVHDGFETPYVSSDLARASCSAQCIGFDRDGDGFCADDCDDDMRLVYPGAPQVCDGVNNDCDDPDWPTPDPDDNPIDNDQDGFFACEDCDDHSRATYPGASEVCDGRNNDCDDPAWPAVPGPEVDADGDGWLPCNNDCGLDDHTIYPGAPQLCDRKANDCNAPSWPAIPPDEVDADGDGFTPCEGDCDDTNPATYPGAPQQCFGGNNDCSEDSWPGPPKSPDADVDGVIDECDVFPGIDFHVRATFDGPWLPGEAAAVTLTLFDELERPVTDVEGVRLGLTVNGSATFGTEALAGVLVAGGGSPSVEVEFVGGLAAVTVTSAVHGNVLLTGQDVSAQGVDLVQIHQNFEVHAGGFHSLDWELGEPTDPPGSPPSGQRLWGTDLDGTDLDLINDLYTAEYVLPVGTQPRIAFKSWLDVDDASLFAFPRTGGLVRIGPVAAHGRFERWEFDVSAFVNQRLSFVFRARFPEDDQFGWYVDDFSILGLPEVLRFLDLAQDEDGDGLSNGDELALGTDLFDPDTDDDGDLDGADNCPLVPNADQRDVVHPGGPGDACDDPDGDGVADLADVCPDVPDPGQQNSDADPLGDACDNCPGVTNPAQTDVVHPGADGDACADPDADGVVDANDNCPDTPNPSQANQDGDRHGDACDPFPDAVLHVRVSHPDLVLIPAPLPLTLVLEDGYGRRVDQAEGVRYGLRLTGPAVFADHADVGSLVAGGGTGEVVLEFVDGVAAIAAVASSPSGVTLEGVDVDRLDADLRELFFDFEDNDGGFTGGGPWEWGDPSGIPDHAASGERVWATGLAGPVAAAGTLVTPPIAIRSPAARLQLRLWSDHSALVRFNGLHGGGSLGLNVGAYALRTISLGQFAGETVTVGFETTASAQARGTYIDDVTVLDSVAPLVFVDPAADSDQDGLSDEAELEGGTDRFDDDTDDDFVKDAVDNCPLVPNRDQSDFIHPGGGGDHCQDYDADGVADRADNCPDDANPDQGDADRDLYGDACDVLPGNTLYIKVEIDEWAFAGEANRVALTLVDAHGVLQSELTGVRFTLALSQGAVFTASSEGVLVSGLGTDRALVEFVDGRVILGIDHSAEQLVRLTGVDTAGGQLSLAALQETFEDHDGGFRRADVDSNWEHGVPESGPFSAASGERLWGTRLAGHYFAGHPQSTHGLDSPSFYTDTAARPRVAFSSWLELVPGDSAGLASLSDSSGSAGLGAGSETSEGWRREVYDLTEVSGGPRWLRWNLTARSQGENYLVAPGWYIDDVVVAGGAFYVRFLDPNADPDNDGLTNREELGLGTAPLDDDTDGDNDIDGADNCPLTYNPTQQDTVRPGGPGDHCEDPDGDDHADFQDNCIDVANPNLADQDGDGVGDACDPFPDAALTVEAEALEWALTGEAITVTYRLRDQRGDFRPDLSGARLLATVDGSASFATEARAGLLLSGGGTQAAVVEFVDGVVTIDVTDALAETVYLGGAPADGSPVTFAARLVQDFEAYDGGFVASGDPVWEYGEPTFVPATSFAGRRAWSTILDGPVPMTTSNALTSPPFRLVAGGGYLRFRGPVNGPSTARSFVDISRDAGANWSALNASNLGLIEPGFRSHPIPSSYGGSEVLFRFRFVLPSAPTRDYAGWTLDDVTVIGVLRPIRFADPDDDSDGDGLTDGLELGLGLRPDQDDTDGDGTADAIDNCPGTPNPDQAPGGPPAGAGAACTDSDGDGIVDRHDNCADLSNPAQDDEDGDGLGDACDPWPSLALAVQPHIARHAAVGLPLRAAFELLDQDRVPLGDLTGVRYTLTSSGGAVFGTPVWGIVHSGVGTNRVEIEFVEGRVELTLLDPTAETITLAGEDAAGLGVRWLDGLFEDFEADDGRLGGHSIWSWGPPRNGPGAAASGVRAWSADPDLTPSASGGLCLIAPALVLPEDPIFPYLEFRSWFASTGTRSSYVLVNNTRSLELKGAAGGYTVHQVSLSNLVGLSTRILFCFEREHGFTGSWSVDDLAIRNIPVTIRFAAPDDDADGDGVSQADEVALGSDPFSADTDGDGIPDGADNCPRIDNPLQQDAVHPDGVGDACQNPDGDRDFDLTDNCPDTPNDDQANADGDRRGDVCDPFPDLNLRIRPVGPESAATLEPVDIVWLLEDAEGVLRDDLGGIQATLVVTGSAVFGDAADAGLLLQGGGTSRARVQFAGGRVALPVTGSTTEIVTVGAEDSEGFGIESLTDTFDNLEAGDGGLVATTQGVTVWEYGISTFAEAPSGRRAWATDLDGPHSSVSGALDTPPMRLPSRTPSTFEVTSLHNKQSGWAAISISTDGANFACVDCDIQNDPRPVVRVLDLGPWAGQEVRLRFDFRPIFAGGSKPGWVIDDLRLRTGGMVLQVFDPLGDADGDGLSDLEESLGGTDPYVADTDSDGVPDDRDNCGLVANSGQTDAIHPGGPGDHCEDPDLDGIVDALDNCPDTANADQANAVHPAPAGDACEDPDGDLVPDAGDNCPDTPNPDQGNLDADASGDACDLCPRVTNPSQDQITGCVEPVEDGGQCLEAGVDILPALGQGRIELYARATPPVERAVIEVVYRWFGEDGHVLQFWLRDELLGRVALERQPASCSPRFLRFEIDDPGVLSRVWDAYDRTELRITHEVQPSPFAPYGLYSGRVDFTAGGRVDSICAFGNCASHDPCNDSVERSDVSMRLDNPAAANTLARTIPITMPDGSLPARSGINTLPAGPARLCLVSAAGPRLHAVDNDRHLVALSDISNPRELGSLPAADLFAVNDLTGAMVAGRAYTLRDIDPGTGRPLSEERGLDAFYGQLVFAEGVLHGRSGNALRVIDPSTGLYGENVVFTGIGNLRELAWNGALDKWYGIADISGNRVLVTLDPGTGTGEVIGPIPPGSGLAAAPDGFLWTALSFGRLARIDPLSGESETLGEPVVNLPSAYDHLAFVPGSRLRDCTDFVSHGEQVLTINGASCPRRLRFPEPTPARGLVEVHR